ncbi:MAG TPA: hypothetical protein VJJ47_04005 [Candidatus Paceibacterota bacterium]
MISLSTEVKRLVILAAARGSRAEIVAAIREGDGLRVLGRRTVPRAELTELLDGARVRGVEVVLGEIAEPLALAAPAATATIPAAPRRFPAPASVFSPFSLDLLLSTQKTRAPNLR